MRIKKNDQVMVIAGKDRGKKGRVIRVYPKTRKVLVEKINYHTIYLRKTKETPNGGISKAEGAIDISNVMLVCPRSGKPTKVGAKFLADGTKHRYSKQSGEIIGE